MIRSQADMTVVGEAGSVEEAVSAYRETSPDVTVLDLGLIDGNGIEVMQIVRREAPQARFVVLTNFEGDEDIHRALAAGAQGYLLKGSSHQLMLDAIRRVHRGGSYLPAPVKRTLSTRTPDSDLTVREREVLALVVKGKSNREIGKELGITEATVKRHMGGILTRMEVTDRTQAVISALRRGLAHL
jgi:DNA-binding NarL/FixJ family response regulator